MSYFNEDQEAHMKYLATVPRDLRCSSGWHVVATDTCDCGPYKPCAAEGCLYSRHYTSDNYCYSHLSERESVQQ